MFLLQFKGKRLLKCYESSQHSAKEKKKKMNSAWRSLIFVFVFATMDVPLNRRVVLDQYLEINLV